MCRFVPALLVAACVIISNAALGADWIGPAGTTGDFSDPNNWSTGLVPTSTTANINNGGTARIGPDDAFEGLAIALGTVAGGSGNFVQDGGNLQRGGSISPGVIVGSVGSGTYLQKSGTNTMWEMDAGINGGGGTYTMEDGYLLAISCILLGRDNGGSGQFVQQGGYVSTQWMTAGYDLGTGSVGLDGGTLAVTDLILGEFRGAGSMIQKSGTLNVGTSCYIGEGASGDYDMRGGAVTGRNLYVAYGISWYDKKLKKTVTSPSYGSFCQSAGSTSFNNIYLGYSTEGPATSANGSFELAGGTLTATNLFVGIGGGAGSFLQSGGTCSIGKVVLNYESVKTYQGFEFSGGTATIGEITGSPSITNARANLIITGTIAIGGAPSFEAVEGAAIHHHGTSFKISGTSSSVVAGLENLSLYVAGQGAAAMQLEVAGADLGAVPGGFVGNFAFDSLILGEDGVGAGRVQLVDLNDNQPGSAISEALYVHHLVIGAGSELDLNGLNLYYETFENAGGTVILNGGSLQQAPEPATLGMLVVGVGVMLRRRHRAA